MLLGRQPFLKKPNFYSVFKAMSKKPKYLDRVAPPPQIFCKMLNNKSELTNWAQNTKQKNTNWHQNLSHKSSKKPYFCSAKMGPSRGGTVPNS